MAHDDDDRPFVPDHVASLGLVDTPLITLTLDELAPGLASEHQQVGALGGTIVDRDGTVLYDLFTELRRA
jgi:hypothetical protein